MGNGKIKILFLIGFFGTGGKERQLAELIKGLPPDMFEIHLLVKSDRTHYLNNIRVKLSSFHSLERKRFGIKAFTDIVKIIIKIRPQIIHSWSDITSLYSVLAKPLVRFKYKLLDGSIRSANDKRKLFCRENLMRVIINHYSDTIITNSFAGIKVYNVPDHKSYCIYNGFDRDRISTIQTTAEIRKYWGIKTRFIVGMVGRIDFEKDYPTFIRAANKLLSIRNDVTFIIVGDGEDREEIQNAVKSEYLDKFIFTGQVSSVESLINVFDIAILTTFYEGLSNAIMEYMALAKPVIATKVGGNAEIVKDGETGILVSINNDEELLQKIIYLLDNPKVAYQMGQKGEKRIVEEFGFNKMINSYINLYNTL